MKDTYSEKNSNHPLQSRQWGKFREAWGNKVLYTKHGLITVHKIPLTKYSIGIFEKGFMPTPQLIKDLIKISKENNLFFIKLEPNYSIKKGGMKCADEKKVIKLLEKNGAVPGKTLFTPSTFWIDLTKSEENLMKSFSSKTRYNIRLAERKGVKVVEDNSGKAFKKYLELTFETTRRQGFYAHTPKYHKLMWKYLHTDMVKKGKKPIAHLMTAVYNPSSHKASKGRGKEIITTWILFTYKGFLYYPYGASTDKYKKVMANNLMMWEAIRFGKKMKLKTFDLWGREPGRGFTRFKEGYNPEVVEFIGSWDLVINKPLYIFYRAAEKVRWFLLKTRGKLFSN